MWLSPLGSTEVPDTACAWDQEFTSRVRQIAILIVWRVLNRCRLWGRLGRSARHGFGMLVWHTHTDPRPTWRHYLLWWAHRLPDCSALWENISFTSASKKRKKKPPQKKKNACFQLTSVYTGWGHRLNHFKHPKESPTPKVNRYRY